MSQATTLPLDAYRAAIALDEPFTPPAAANTEELPELAAFVARHLVSERWAAVEGIHTGVAPLDYPHIRHFINTLLTMRPAQWMDAPVLHAIDRILQNDIEHRALNNAFALPRNREQFPKTSYAAADKTVLWQGDIATLKVDAIVNAANNQLLGCFQPFHACIDNVIHSLAGPRLRDDCHTIMGLQNDLEPTGEAKITRGYNLPSRYVMHTVGPIIGGGRTQVSDIEKSQLNSCYTACLDLAAQIEDLRSLAFCCISTGVFGYPQEQAAQTALTAVANWMSAHPDALDLVIFNVFTLEDLGIYKALLQS